MAISTLYDYYTSKGQALPSLSTRSGLYSQYGLTGNYTGTAQQNTALLQKLMSGSTTPTTTTVAPTPTTTFSTTPVAADTLSAPTTQIRLPASNFDTGGAADSTVAGATTTQKSLQDYINQLTAAKTPEQTQADALSSSISDLLGQNTGRSTALGVEEANRGVPGISKDLADINAQIATRTAAYDKQYNAITNPTDPNKMAILPVAGSQAEALRRQEASDIGFLQARALGLQGQLSAAQDAAKRAVDLRYGAIEEQINTKLQQLQLLQPTLDKQEKIQAQALQMKYEADQRAIADKKAETQALYNMIVTPEGAAAGVKTTDTLAQAAQKISTYLGTQGGTAKFGVISSYVDDTGRVVNQYGWIDDANRTITPYNPSGSQGNLNLGAQVGTLLGLPTYNTQNNNPGVVRAVRNNNPGNIKATATSIKYPGVIGIESTPALDGGNFLIFADPASGQNAIGNILKLGIYSGLTAEQAIKKYNGGGSYGAADVGLDPNKSFSTQIANPSVLQSVISSITRLEGYPDTVSNQSAPNNTITAAAALISQGRATLANYPETLRAAITRELAKPEYANVTQQSEYQVQTNQRILQSVQELLPLVSSTTVGLLGKSSSFVPGTPAYNFNAQLDTLKSNIAFGALTAMREASKTGGALGQVSDREGKLLESSLAALDIGQSPDQFKLQLQKIEDSINRWNQAAGGTIAPGTQYQIGTIVQDINGKQWKVIDEAGNLAPL